mmetsp:Transcript_16818/g.37887  ORF Transcript_16818/g.37887 Transcript_16818/m.37887 type:complete len:721 (+) Transcript_16818:73-2235(+)
MAARVDGRGSSSRRSDGSSNYRSDWPATSARSLICCLLLLAATVCSAAESPRLGASGLLRAHKHRQRRNGHRIGNGHGLGLEALDAAEIEARMGVDQSLKLVAMGGGMGVDMSAGDDGPDMVISNAPDMAGFLNGVYRRTDWCVNDRPHFERQVEGGRRSRSGDGEGNKIHLYWSGTQWVLHRDLDPSRSLDNLLAYAKGGGRDSKGRGREDGEDGVDPRRTTSTWFVKVGQTYQPSPRLRLRAPDDSEEEEEFEEGIVGARRRDEVLGVPRQLLPYYAAYMCDAMATGLVMPLLPFHVMGLGADALQLSLVVSSNYVAQMAGCIVMGRVSDLYGRRAVLIACLAASTASYLLVSQARTLPAVALARLVAGSLGGLLPVMQACVADCAPLDERPKYLGRIMATFGLGFVLGPALNAVLPRSLSTPAKIRLAAIFPLLGLVLAVLFAKESKRDAKGVLARAKFLTTKPSYRGTAKVGAKTEAPLRLEVVFLVLNGFLIMYAFGTETIYAMFIKDTFGYGETALSALFALNGLVMGVFQVFAIKPLINLIGKHATLAAGNLLLGAGMLGLALIRDKARHFFFFAVHILGYSIADTALVSLVSRYSDPSSQGRDLALNQAAQACARIFSPLVAGLLYERSKRMNALGQGLLPMGALPFLVGGMCPAVAVMVPTLLYVRNKALKSRQAQMVERLAAESANGSSNGNGDGNGDKGGHDRWNNNNT